MISKFIKFTFSLGLLFFVLYPTISQAASDTVYIFHRDGCPHCAEEILFLSGWQKQDKSVDWQGFEVSKNSENLELLKQVGAALDSEVNSVPLTIVGDKYISGFYNAEITGEQIKLFVDQCRQLGCPDLVSQIQDGTYVKENTDTTANLTDTVNLPWLGEVNWREFSLPIFTIVIAGLDGFNPCAMWVLIFLIGLLLGMENKKKMWILGITFLAASATVYFIFMAAWLNLFIFLGFIAAVRIVIGLVALASGSYNIREWWHNKTGACKVTGGQKRQRIFAKLKTITQEKSFLLAFFGVIILAFVVNLVELVCSAGLPAVYTQVLILSDLPSVQYYLYLLLYIFIFLLDDIVVFTVAMVTLQVTGMSTKYSRYSNLIGGVLMIIIGLLLIFKPEWLMFG